MGGTLTLVLRGCVCRDVGSCVYSFTLHKLVLSKIRQVFSRVVTIKINQAKIIIGNLGIPIETCGPDQSRRTHNNLPDSNSISQMC